MEEGRGLEDKEMTFWEHLAELSVRLRRIIGVTLLLTFIMMLIPAKLNWDDILAVMGGDLSRYRPLVSIILTKIREDILPPSLNPNESEIEIMSTKFANAITIYFEGSILFALAIASPYIAYEIYMFIAPGLYPHEKRFIKTFVGSFTGLFIIGVLYGYYIILPITFRFLLYFSMILEVQTWFDVLDFYHIVFLGLILNGLFFTLPVFLTLAMKFGVINPELLSGNRRYIYLGLLIFTAIITPDPTPVSMILLSLPFILFYEIAIVIGRRVYPYESS